MDEILVRIIRTAERLSWNYVVAAVLFLVTGSLIYASFKVSFDCDAKIARYEEMKKTARIKPPRYLIVPPNCERPR